MMDWKNEYQKDEYHGAAEDALARLEAAWEQRSKASNRWCLALGFALGLLFASVVLWTWNLW